MLYNSLTVYILSKTSVGILHQVRRICFTKSTYPSQKAFKQGLPLQVKNKSNCREDYLPITLLDTPLHWEPQRFSYRERKGRFNPDNSIKQYKNSIFLHLMGKKRPFYSQSLHGEELHEKRKFPITLI